MQGLAKVAQEIAEREEMEYILRQQEEAFLERMFCLLYLLSYFAAFNRKKYFKLCHLFRLDKINL